LVRHEGAESNQPMHLWLSISGSEITGPHGAVSLSEDEQRLLSLLIEQPGSVFTPETLLSFVWGPYYIHDRKKLLDSLAALRRLLCTAGLPATAIQELRDIGYRLLPSIEIVEQPLALSA